MMLQKENFFFVFQKKHFIFSFKLPSLLIYFSAVVNIFHLLFYVPSV